MTEQPLRVHLVPLSCWLQLRLSFLRRRHSPACRLENLKLSWVLGQDNVDLCTHEFFGRSLGTHQPSCQTFCARVALLDHTKHVVSKSWRKASPIPPAPSSAAIRYVLRAGYPCFPCTLANSCCLDLSSNMSLTFARAKSTCQFLQASGHSSQRLRAMNIVSSLTLHY